MKKPYSEKSFIIDLISDAYKIRDPMTISQYSKDIFNINLEILEIIDCLSGSHEIKKNINSLRIEDVFDK